MTKYIDTRTITLTLLLVGLGLLVALFDWYSAKAAFTGSLERPDYRKGAATDQVLVAKEGEEAKEVTVSVTPRELSAKQAAACLDQAREEIDGSAAGDNPSLEAVSRDLKLSETYADGYVAAEWHSSEPAVINSEGKVDYEAVAKREGKEPVYLTAKLSCGKKERNYEIAVIPVLPGIDTPEGFLYHLQQAIQQADAKSSKQQVLYLPKALQGQKLTWSKAPDNRGWLLALLGLCAGAAVVFGRREEERRAAAARQKEFNRDYPAIVSMLSLYVSAGVTVREAFRRIYQSYRYGRKRDGPANRPGYEAVGLMLHKMEDGAGEGACYTFFGQITENENYNKLAMLLNQNNRRGQRGLAELLEKEEREAFAKRKLAAKTAGEEASTKLLVPMLMLLGVVLVIMIAPALFALDM